MIYRSISFLFVLVWILTPILLTAQNQNSVQGDHAALMDIYRAMDGDNWHNNRGWGGAPSTMGNWFGVTTNSSGRVTHLDLQTGKPFSNDLPDNRLHKRGNNLSNADRGGNLRPGREFPESIGNLKELRYLNVKNNTIRGPIPKSITLLAKAERILLEGHWREPDPGSGSNAPYNHPVSSSSGKTTAGTNFWTGPIPENVGNLKNLVVWESQQTAITGSIPKQFGQLQNLEMLLLNGIRQNRDNSLKMSGQIPSELGNASSLRYLYLGEQNFSGQIPPELGKLRDLKQLRINHWPLTSGGLTGAIPEALGDIPDLRILILGGNQLTGGFPSFLFHSRTALHTISLPWNNLSGTLPEKLNPSSNFNVLALSRNNFSGPIPDWVTSRGLIQMNLDNNEFSGDLPPGFHDQKARIWNHSGGRLRNLNLDNNKLTGRLPSVNIGRDIWNMRFQNNNFTGTLPAEWGGIRTRRALRIWVNNNNLSGRINPAIARINNLSTLGISGNRFSNSDTRDLNSALSSIRKMSIVNNIDASDTTDYIDEKAILDLDGEPADDPDYFDSTDEYESVTEGTVETALDQNYPNPFNPSTQIQFSVSEPQQISLKVYDMAGRQVATLFEGMAQSGIHHATFNAGNLASGIYFYRLVTGSKVFNGRMTLLK